MAMRGVLDEIGRKVEVETASVSSHTPANSEAHRHDHGVPRRKRRFGEWLFLASASDRLAFVILLVALIWLAVVWAMG